MNIVFGYPPTFGNSEEDMGSWTFMGVEPEIM
jgi:hypothetical protein